MNNPLILPLLYFYLKKLTVYKTLLESEEFVIFNDESEKTKIPQKLIVKAFSAYIHRKYAFVYCQPFSPVFLRNCKGCA